MRPPGESIPMCCSATIAMVQATVAPQTCPVCGDDYGPDVAARHALTPAAPRTLSDATLRRVLAGLVGAQSHSADLRSVSYGVESSGGLCEITATERAIDAGAVSRGRVSWSRLSRLAARHRPALAWLIDRAHAAPDVAAFARLYALADGPVALRESAAVAPAEADAARSALARARRLLSAATTPETIALHAVARDRSVAASARDASSAAALAAWGTAALADACAAWMDTDDEAA